MFDPAPLTTESLEELTAAMVEATGQIAAAECLLLMRLAQFDARGNVYDTDSRSAADWLAARCCIPFSRGAEMLRVGRRLWELPVIAEAYGTGQLTYSSVRQLVRIATPETEAAMVELARLATADQLQRIVASYRRVLAAAADPKAPNAKREVRWYFDSEGFFCFFGRLPAEAGIILRNAIEHAAEELKEKGRNLQLFTNRDEQPPGKVDLPETANRADALVAIAESSLAHDLASRPSPERTQVVVHVSAETLAGTGDGEHCELEAGPEIAAETARRLACDAAVVGIVESATAEPLSVGRRTRRISPAMARALRCRDAGCVFPGCGRRRFVEAHHIKHWAQGGETSLDNLANLCWFHHHLIHEGGYGVARDPETRALVFSRPDGAVIDQIRILPSPPEGQLDLELDLSCFDRRDPTVRVEYNDVIGYFIRHDSRIPKPDPPPK